MLQLRETATALTASRFVTWLMLDGSHIEGVACTGERLEKPLQ